MPRYEYKVVPAPTRGLRGKGVKGAEGRFAHAVQELINGLSGSGWEYQRAETLPSVERSGLTGSTTEWRNLLVFRRLRAGDADAFAPELLPAPTIRQPDAEEAAQDADVAVAVPETEAETEVATADTTASEDAAKAAQPWDNGVEDTDDVARVGASLETLAKARKADKSDR